MSIFKSSKIKKWKPDSTRKPPSENDWPDSIVHLSNDNFDEFIDKYPLSIIDFWAEWCAPCKAMDPVIQQLSDEYKGKVAFGKVDVAQEKEIAKKYRVMGIPKFIFISYNVTIITLTGTKTLDDMKKRIDEVLSR